MNSTISDQVEKFQSNNNVAKFKVNVNFDLLKLKISTGALPKDKYDNNAAAKNKKKIHSKSSIRKDTSIESSTFPTKSIKHENDDTNKALHDNNFIVKNEVDSSPEISKSEQSDTLTWGTIIPLIGGSAIGCSKSVGTQPDFHLSYTAFSKNEKHLDRYWPLVPKYHLDKEPNLKLPFKNVDFINSVCPCAGLSMLNNGSGLEMRGSDNETNKWMIDTATYVLEKVKPKVLWGENAPGLFSGIGEGVVDGLIEVGKRFGYSFSIMKTNSELHGLPQKRIRTFYFFWNTPTVPQLAWKNTQAKGLLEYLNEIPVDATLQDMFMYEGKATERFRPYQFVLEKVGLTHAQFYARQKTGTISKWLEKKNLELECIEWLRENYPNDSLNQPSNGKARTHIEYIEHCMRKKSMGKGYWDDSPRFFGQSFGTLMNKTIHTAVHPVEDRYLNVREMMHLMGLPHDFQIDRAQNINHIAQNVPVNTAQDWADEVKLFCQGKAELTQYSFLKQDNIKQMVVSGIKFGNDDKENVVERFTPKTNVYSEVGKVVTPESTINKVVKPRIDLNMKRLKPVKNKEDIVEGLPSRLIKKREPRCFKCDKISSNLRNHILSHYYSNFEEVVSKFHPFACPICNKPSRDFISTTRHYAFTHKMIFELTDVTEDQLNGNI